MSTGNIVANGLSAYLQTKQALNQQEFQKEQQTAWEQDRAQKQADQQARDKLYNSMAPADIGGMDVSNAQPADFAAQTGQNAPASTQQTAPAQAATQPGAPTGAEMAQQGIGTSVSNPTPTAPTTLSTDGLAAAKAKLDGYRVEAARLGDQAALNLIAQKQQALLGHWASTFQGDTTTMQGALDYAQHIAKGAAVLGNPLTPDQALNYANAATKYHQEGVIRALQYANVGDKASALQFYNSQGGHKFADLQLTPEKSSAGTPSYHVIGINTDGSKVDLGNSFNNMMAMSTATQQLDAFIKTQNAQNDTTRANNDSARTKASVTADYATANLRNVEAKQKQESPAGGLTVPQQRTNESIVAARKQLTGMTPADIKRMTTAATATGRENPDYDPNIARLTKLANSRMYGDDPEFDKFNAAKQTPAAGTGDAQSRTEVAKKFRADPQMNGMTLGNTTPQGVEVLKQGKVVGYYN